MNTLKAVGLVVEYNPFHNGHAYHAAESKRRTGADLVIAVMSGPFLQRGEPALISKWARAEMALLSGVDLVFELPYSFAVQSAELFAKGSISMLEELKCDTFSFGSEDGKIEPFIAAYSLLQQNKEPYNLTVKSFLAEGHSYPKAAALTFQAMGFPDNLPDLSLPNNILGMEYVKTARSNQFSIKPFTIPRLSAGYHDAQLPKGPIASATGIRQSLAQTGRKLTEIESYVPKTTKHVLEQYESQYHHFHNWEMYWPYLKYKILSSSAEELSAIYELEEGIENRMLSIAAQSANFHEFMTKMKTKRYTWTRIQRMCVHVLINTTKVEMSQYLSSLTHLRLLGMTSTGRTYLKMLKKDLNIPIVSRLSSFDRTKTLADVRAASIYALGLTEPYQSLLVKREYEAPVVID
jgi:predicted nucleotidyltransferase